MEKRIPGVHGRDVGEKGRERRASGRISANVPVSYFHNAMFYHGCAHNISPNGMFIRTTWKLLEDSIFSLVINIDDKVLTVIARVKWVKNADGHDGGIGVEIINPPQDFVEFIKSMKDQTLI